MYLYTKLFSVKRGVLIWKSEVCIALVVHKVSIFENIPSLCILKIPKITIWIKVSLN